MLTTRTRFIACFAMLESKASPSSAGIRRDKSSKVAAILIWLLAGHGEGKLTVRRQHRLDREVRSMLCWVGLISLAAFLVSCGGGSFQPRQLISISVLPSDAVATVPGGTVPFSATGTFNAAPTTETLAAEWTSSDPTVATVDPNTGVASCAATGGPISVTATAVGKGGSLHGSATLTCSASQPPLVGFCAVNGSAVTGACWVNSCSTVVDSAHCPVGQPPIAAKTVITICIPGPPLPHTIDTGRSCGP